MTGLLAEIRRALAELEMVSHAPTQTYGAVLAPGSDEDVGGKRPPGSDWEPRPRSEDELAAWEACYQRRTVSYYRARLRSRGPSDALLADVRRTVEAWRKMQIPAGQPPAPGDPLWKRYVAESPLDGGELARIFNVSREYIRQVRKAYREAA